MCVYLGITPRQVTPSSSSLFKDTGTAIAPPLPPGTSTHCPASTAISPPLVPMLEVCCCICCSHICCGCGCSEYRCTWRILSSAARFRSASSLCRIPASFPLPLFFAPAPFFFLVSTGGCVAECPEPFPFRMPLDGALKSKDAISIFASTRTFVSQLPTLNLDA